MAIKHVFVLMMENRSFDHIFGYSGICGRDAVTGALTYVDGLLPTGRFNIDPRPGHNNQKVWTSPTATFTQGRDVEHEFVDVLTQLCGLDAARAISNFGKLPGGVYPPIDMGGFVADEVSCRAGGDAVCFDDDHK